MTKNDQKWPKMTKNARKTTKTPLKTIQKPFKNSKTRTDETQANFNFFAQREGGGGGGGRATRGTRCQRYDLVAAEVVRMLHECEKKTKSKKKKKKKKKKKSPVKTLILTLKKVFLCVKTKHRNILARE